MVSAVRIGRFLTRAEAAVARGLLGSYGIEAHVLGDDGAGVQPYVSYGYGGISLAVHPDDEAEARELLADLDDPIERADLRPRGLRPRLILLVAALMLTMLGLDLLGIGEVTMLH